MYAGTRQGARDLWVLVALCRLLALLCDDNFTEVKMDDACGATSL